MESPAESIKYHIGSWDLGDNDFILQIRVHGSLFIIEVWSDSFIRSPIALQKFNKYLDWLRDGDDTAEELWAYLDWIAHLYLAQFQALAPAIRHTGKLTLANIVFAKKFESKLSMLDEKPVPGTFELVGPDEDMDLYDGPEHLTPVDILHSLPPLPFTLLSTSEVEVPYDNPDEAFYTIPQRVFAQGRELYYKVAVSEKGLRTSIEKYTKIAASGLSADKLRTSRLYGIVSEPKGRILGLLYDWIDIDQTLTWAVEAETPSCLREKWATQVKETVVLLHNLGLVWGDVKAENVLINKQGNAVVIDLEGGISRGWVDEDKGGTVKGDLQGLENMMDFIFNNESTLRPNLGLYIEEFKDNEEMDDYNKNDYNIKESNKD